jgi:hypothetical protein
MNKFRVKVGYIYQDEHNSLRISMWIHTHIYLKLIAASTHKHKNI